MVVYLGVRRGVSISNSHYVLYNRYQCDNESQIRSCIKQCVLVSQKLKTRLSFLCEIGPAYQLALEGLKSSIPNNEDMNDVFEVLKVIKRNGSRVSKDKTVSDVNRNITFYQDYENARGLRQTVGVKILID